MSRVFQGRFADEHAGGITKASESEGSARGLHAFQPLPRTLRHPQSSAVLFLLLAAPYIPPAVAQNDGQGVKFSVHSDLILLPTRVQDKHGKTIYGLKAEQFMVDDDGERQRVEVEEQPDPFGLSLVRSSSVF